MITGTYIFYENGTEIYRSSNIITKFGKRFLSNFIAGNFINSDKDVAIGIGTTAATDSDSRLVFEFYRMPVLFGSTDIQTASSVTTYNVVYSATIPQDVSGQINEIGLYPTTRLSINNFDSKFLSDFSNGLEWFTSSGDNPDSSTTGPKIGDEVLVFESNGSSSREYFYTIEPLDFSGYSVNDTLKLAYFKNDSNLESIKVRLYSSDSDYYETTITDTSGTGYKISSDILMSSVYSNFSGSPDKTQINKIGIVITPQTGLSTTVGMDGLRINDEDTFDPYFGLISRSVLSTPLNKISGRAVDIEYKLELSF